MKPIHKHNFSLRLQDLSKTIGLLVTDFVEKYDLETGCKYRVESTDGKYFDGFFNSLQAKMYRDNLDVWCRFYKSKKDGDPSKVETGIHISNVANISLIPF